jgi:hypothetical protein
MVAPVHAQSRKLKEQLAQAEDKHQPDTLGHGPLALTITGVRQLSARVRAYELRDAHGADLPEARAGAHLEVPVRLADGTESSRRYSIASPPGQRKVYEIAVLRHDAGASASVRVHDEFRLGLTLHCALPQNHFSLDDSADPVVLIAGGIGITPIKAMAHALRARGRRFELHYAVRSRSDAPYLEQLEAEFGEALRVYPGDEEARMDVSALISASRNAHYYVCGPGRLIDAVRKRARIAGVNETHIHFERFAGPSHADEDQPVTVTLAKSGRVVEVAAQQSILDAVQEAGIYAPASCRTGNCAMCAVKVSEGIPDHRDEVLTNKQRDSEKLMCICVSRAVGENLTIDL